MSGAGTAPMKRRNKIVRDSTVNTRSLPSRELCGKRKLNKKRCVQWEIKKMKSKERISAETVSTAWRATFVFLQWWAFEAASCPAACPELRGVIKRRTKIKLITYISPHHCANILLVAVWPSPHFIRSLLFSLTLIINHFPIKRQRLI